MAGRNTVQTTAALMLSGTVCWYIGLPEAAVYPSGKSVVGCDFTKTRSPDRSRFQPCDVIQFALAAEGRVSLGETRQTDSESAPLAGHTA